MRNLSTVLDNITLPVDAEFLKGRVYYGGLDLSSTMDITAFVLVFPPTEEDEPFAVLPYFWIPAGNIDLRVRRDHVPYDVWERQGFLMTTEGNVVHYVFIETFIEKLGEKYTSARLLSTDGARCRWCRTSRGWASRSFPSGRASRI